jgi:peroxin-1
MNLSSDVDLMECAKRLEGFSGADLQGLMYTAYLEAVHEEMAESDSENGTEAESTGGGAKENSEAANEIHFKVLQSIEGSNMSNAERHQLKERVCNFFTCPVGMEELNFLI